MKEKELKAFEKTCPDCGKVYIVKAKLSQSPMRLCDDCKKKRNRQVAAKYYSGNKTDEEATSDQELYEVNILCPVCGETYTYHYQKKYKYETRICRACLSARYSSQRKESLGELREKRAARKRAPKHGYSLAEVGKMAKERHISYGKMSALLYAGVCK